MAQIDKVRTNLDAIDGYTEKIDNLSIAESIKYHLNRIRELLKTEN